MGGVLGYIGARLYVNMMFKRYRSIVLDIRYTIIFGTAAALIGTAIGTTFENFHVINDYDYRMNLK